MATQKQTDAVAKAVQSDVNAEIKADVPVIFQNDVPTDKLVAFVTKVTHDAITAYEQARDPIAWWG